MKKTLASVSAVALAAVLASPPSDAAVLHSWTYGVSWGGPPTLLVTEYGGPDTHVELAVDGWSTGVGFAPTGMVIGVDPHIDPVLGLGATWASCTLWVDGVVVANDYAEAGDGSDVICTAVA